MREWGLSLSLASIDPVVAPAAVLAPTHTIKKKEPTTFAYGSIDLSFFFILLVLSVTKLLLDIGYKKKEMLCGFLSSFYMHDPAEMQLMDRFTPPLTKSAESLLWIDPVNEKNRTS